MCSSTPGSLNSTSSPKPNGSPASPSAPLCPIHPAQNVRDSTTVSQKNSGITLNRRSPVSSAAVSRAAAITCGICVFAHAAAPAHRAAAAAASETPSSGSGHPPSHSDRPPSPPLGYTATPQFRYQTPHHDLLHLLLALGSSPVVHPPRPAPFKHLQCLRIVRILMHIQ